MAKLVLADLVVLRISVQVVSLNDISCMLKSPHLAVICKSAATRNSEDIDIGAHQALMTVEFCVYARA